MSRVIFDRVVERAAGLKVSVSRYVLDLIKHDLEIDLSNTSPEENSGSAAVEAIIPVPVNCSGDICGHDDGTIGNRADQCGSEQRIDGYVDR